MAIHTIEVEGPAFLATALLYGDVDHLSEDDMTLLDAFLDYTADLQLVGVADPDPTFNCLEIGSQNFVGETIIYSFYFVTD